MQAQSKYIKSILCLGDINEVGRVDQSRCFTLQHFDYTLGRMLGERNEMLNIASEAFLNLSIKVQPDNILTDIYSIFERDAKCTLSVIFNGDFDPYGVLDSYENALVATGYMLKLEETFGRSTDSSGGVGFHERAILNVQFVMTELQYLSGGSSVGLKF